MSQRVFSSCIRKIRQSFIVICARRIFSYVAFPSVAPLTVQIRTLDGEAPVVAQIADFGLARRVFGFLKSNLNRWEWLAPEVVVPSAAGYDHSSDVTNFRV
jgi:hypothetical protein